MDLFQLNTGQLLVKFREQHTLADMERSPDLRRLWLILITLADKHGKDYIPTLTHPYDGFLKLYLR